MSLRAAALACFVVGVALLVPFDAPVTLALGVVLLLAAVGLGTVTVAGSLLDAED
jgi:hypothetical protein